MEKPWQTTFWTLWKSPLELVMVDTQSRVSPELANFLMAIGERPREVTRNDLFRIFANEKQFMLEKLETTMQSLEACNLEIKPSLLNDTRSGLYLLKQRGKFYSASVGNEFKHESSTVEFKSTYWCDLDRYEHDSRAQRSDLRSDTIKFSSLKTIAAFLTTKGGSLYIGRNDNGDYLNLSYDLNLLDPKKSSLDGLINIIRSDIADRFYEGNNINDFVEIDVIRIRGAQCIKVGVSPRKPLSFICDFRSNQYQLFRRQGNRTTRVEIQQVPQFIDYRRETDNSF